jgi:2-keto-4-pentenoate hydratase/2-oxohepta-3-ene-1,7-dioic acid hydratase in catechol pathway
MARKKGTLDMTLWLRFEKENRTRFGTLEDVRICVHEGDMFGGSTPTGDTVDVSSVRLLTPTEPSKMICLWNNFHELAKKLGTPVPASPLYFLKASSSFLGHGGIIRRPSSYRGKIVYEGELGIVIGSRCTHVLETDAPDCIFGYTCVNDVTAAEIINEDPSFAQWTRAKSFDTFGSFGPVIATELNPMMLYIRTILNGEERQNYAIGDMIFPPHQLVSLISQDMTLMPGDVIACGTSIGVGAMKEPINTVEVSIDGIGTLRNVFENQV